MKFLISTVLAISVAATAVKGAGDPIFTALKDEMDRSIKRLRIVGHEAPYFISYTVHDTDNVKITGSFGAIADKSHDHNRTLAVDVRVGSYKLDNTPAGSDFGRFRQNQTNALPIENNYNALRHKIWLCTDSAYKKAIESLESNKTYLKDNTVTDRPDSFSVEEPVVYEEAPAALSVNMNKWSATVRKLSEIFRQYPKIRSSHIGFSALSDTHWYLNSEGFRNRIGETGWSIAITAVAQADDGMRLNDDELVAAYKENELPSEDDLVAIVRAMADRLTKLTAAPAVDEYTGPILFEGQASAQFFHELLDEKLVATGGTGRMATSGDLSKKIGQRILPKFISLVDDPTAVEYQGQKLLGTYVVDDDGVKGQKITLVDKGILKTFCIGRAPTKLIKHSNGHAHRGSAATTNLFVISENQQPLASLKSKLISMGKEDGLKDVYIARRLATDLSADPLSMQAFVKMLSGGVSLALSPPILLFKVSVEDGHEELVRGAQFTNISLRTLRDIDATGDDVKAYPASNPHEVTSIIAPSILLREIEIQKPDGINSKPPILKHPYFDKRKN